MAPEHLAAAVRPVRSGDALLAPAITRRLVERFAPHPPGPVRAHPARTGVPRSPGSRPQQREATVKTHVARILAELRLRGRAQAVMAAYETGWGTPAAPGNAHPV